MTFASEVVHGYCLDLFQAKLECDADGVFTAKELPARDIASRIDHDDVDMCPG